MLTNTFTGTFENLAQRVAFTYLKMLALLPAGADTAQRDLHTFFQAVYEGMAQTPALFGLALDADIQLPHERTKETLDLQEVNRRLAKPRGQVEMGINFLMAAGQAGTLKGNSLMLTAEAFAECQAKPKVVRKFINGLVSAGLELEEANGQVALRSARYPAMMPALQSLAQACAQYDPPDMGRVLFARCDFQALRPGYIPEVLDLYRIFNPRDYEHLKNLHEFFTRRGYQASVQIGRIFSWVVQYQGNRKIKASPLFQVEFQERFSNPLFVSIKCASANRITALVARHSPALQDDFFQRSLRCRGTECNWCETRKGMEPSVLVYGGQQYSTCWYVPPEIRELTDATVELIKEYALMHEELLAVN